MRCEVLVCLFGAGGARGRGVGKKTDRLERGCRCRCRCRLDLFIRFYFWPHVVGASDGAFLVSFFECMSRVTKNDKYGIGRYTQLSYTYEHNHNRILSYVLLFLAEREGRTTQSRPAPRLIWCEKGRGERS